MMQQREKAELIANIESILEPLALSHVVVGDFFGYDCPEGRIHMTAHNIATQIVVELDNRDYRFTIRKGKT